MSIRRVHSGSRQTSLTSLNMKSSINNSGQYRWVTNFRFYSIGLVKAGWVEKSGRTWKLMESAQNFELLSPLEIFDFIVDAYGKWDSDRKIEDEIAEVEIEESEEPEILMQVKPKHKLSGINCRCRIQIPPFQRSFVWRPSDIRYLLDSIYRRYPVGSFIFWKTIRKLPRTRSIGNISFENRDISRGH